MSLYNQNGAKEVSSKKSKDVTWICMTGKVNISQVICIHIPVLHSKQRAIFINGRNKKPKFTLPPIPHGAQLTSLLSLKYRVNSVQSAAGAVMAPTIRETAASRRS